MKRALLVLLVFSSCLNQVMAACRPIYSSMGETNVGCDALSKQVAWVVSWPDGYADTLMASGTGVCTHTQVCCSQNVVQLECWPAFYTPTTSTNGTFSQIV